MSDGLGVKLHELFTFLDVAAMSAATANWSLSPSEWAMSALWTMQN
jgi:hypothetical protein